MRNTTFILAATCALALSAPAHAASISTDLGVGAKVGQDLDVNVGSDTRVDGTARTNGATRVAAPIERYRNYGTARSRTAARIHNDALLNDDEYPSRKPGPINLGAGLRSEVDSTTRLHGRGDAIGGDAMADASAQGAIDTSGEFSMR